MHRGGAVEVDDALSETSTNPVQNKIVTKSIGNLSNKISKMESNEVALPTGHYDHPVYVIFGKLNSVEIVRNGQNAFLVTAFGVGNIERKPGLYFISCCTRGSIQMHVVEIIAGHKEISFGYFISGDYVYFGVKTAPYNYDVVLKNNTIHGAGAEVGYFYTSDQAPEGWAEVAITKFATN